MEIPRVIEFEQSKRIGKKVYLIFSYAMIMDNYIYVTAIDYSGYAIKIVFNEIEPEQIKPATEEQINEFLESSKKYNLDKLYRHFIYNEDYTIEDEVKPIFKRNDNIELFTYRDKEKRKHGVITHVNKEEQYYVLEDDSIVPFKNQNFYTLRPKFREGDKIISKETQEEFYVIFTLDRDYIISKEKDIIKGLYPEVVEQCKDKLKVHFNDQDNYILVEE